MRLKAGLWRIAALIALIFLGLALFGCRQASTPQDPSLSESRSAIIDSRGGDVYLKDATHIGFEVGFFSTPAQVTVSTSALPPSNYPSGSEDYVASTKPIALSTRIEISYAAIDTSSSFEDRKHVYIRVPSLSHNPNMETFAEVRLRLSDGEELFFLEPYLPVASGDNPPRNASGEVISLDNLQLKALGPSVLKNVVITVQPVAATPLSLQSLPVGFVLEDVVTGLNKGVVFDFAADGQKRGVVRVFEDGNLSSTPFIDISNQVNNRSDRGMLGLAVHPEFPIKPYIYLLFAYDPPEVYLPENWASDTGGPDGTGARVARLIRVTADAKRNYNVAVAGSELVLLGSNSTYANIGDPNTRNGATPSCGRSPAYVRDCLPADETSHTIGTVRFGNDGSLFVGNGDGANWSKVEPYATRALDVDSLSGKIMRLDPLTGKGLASNPFYNGDPDSNRSKVYSLGLRNPFRFTVHPTTSEPFIGDVGWKTWEEINTGRGVSFGWPCYEGGDGISNIQGGYKSLPYCQAFYENKRAVVPAAFAYLHTSGGSSGQVGDFYTGSAYPAEYRNALFIFDYNMGWIRYLTFDARGSVATVNTFINELGTVQISAGPNGDLFLMNYAEGKLKQLRYPVTNNPPTARASATPQSGVVPLTVQFSSSGSSDPDGDSLSYAWRFGDGATSTAANPTHTYTTSGVYTARLTVTDLNGASASNRVIIEAGSRPIATLLTPQGGSRYNVGERISFSGSATDPEDGTLRGESLSWDLKLHHNNHVHPDGLAPTTGESGSFVAPDHGDNTSLELCLTATDSSGRTSAPSCTAMHFNTVSYTLDTVPSGLELTWEGTSRTTPFTVETFVGSRRQVIAASRQGDYEFRSWSNGGNRIHELMVGVSPQTLIASYGAPVTASGKLETAIVENVSSSSWTTVNLKNNYIKMVSVCSVNYHNNTVPEVVRMRRATNSSFQLRLQNPSRQTLRGERVSCLVAEAGAWKLPDGRPFEAWAYINKTTARKGSWASERRSYLQRYINPVILGQVMTFNDSNWSVFWSRGSSRGSPPSSTVLRTGKHIGEDKHSLRHDETIGYIVIEAGNGSVAGLVYEAGLGTKTILGTGNSPPGGSYTFNWPFARTPTFAVV
jgi:PKD repeat protein